MGVTTRAATAPVTNVEATERQATTATAQAQLPVRVAYLMNYYPTVSHTFILRELHALDPSEVETELIATNVIGPENLLSDLERAEQARTFYVQGQSNIALARTIVSIAARRPLRFLGALRVAIAAARFDVRLLVRQILYLLEAVVVADYCRTKNVRHIHAHFGQTPASVAWFATEIGNRCLPDHGPWTWSATIHGWHEFVNEKEAVLARKVDTAAFLVCISDFTRSQLMRLSKPKHWHKLHVVRCGLDLSQHQFVEGHRNDGPPVLVMTARYSAEKGHLILLEAIKILAGRGVIVRARLIGGGEFRSELAAAVARLGLGAQVDLVGTMTQDDVRCEVARADAFVLPTFAEGLPVSIMEAMAAGTPVVTTPISGIPELIEDGRTGYLARPGRADDLADAIERVFSDPHLRDSIVKNARVAVEEHHDIAHNVNELERLFVANVRATRA